VARIGRILQESHPQKSESYIALDAAMVVLGGVLLWMVGTHLRFDDARWQYNAWTYLIAVPTALVLISLLLRFVVGKFVERSMQVAFLLSVTVHLILLLAAVNVIIFSKWWPDIYEAISQQVPKEQTAKQYFTTANAQSVTGSRSSRPDYMRAVETEHEATEEELTADGAMQLAVQEQADLPTLQPDENRNQKVQAALMERAEIVPTAPSDEPRMAELSRSRPELARPTNQKVNIPEVKTPSGASEPVEANLSEAMLAISREENMMSQTPIQAPQALSVPEPMATADNVKPTPIRKAETRSPVPQEMAFTAGRDVSRELEKSATLRSPASRSTVPRVMVPDRPAKSMEESPSTEPTVELVESMAPTETSRTESGKSSSQTPRPISSAVDVPNATSINKPRNTTAITERNREAVTPASGVGATAPEMRLSKSTPALPKRSGVVRNPLATFSENGGAEATSNDRPTESIESLAELGAGAPARSGRGSGGSGTNVNPLSQDSSEGFAVESATVARASSLPFQRKGRDAIAEVNQGELSSGLTAAPMSKGKQLSGSAVRRPGSGTKIDIPDVPGRGESREMDSDQLAEKSDSPSVATEGDQNKLDAAEVALDLVSEVDRQEPNSVAADRVLEVDAADGVGGLLKNAEGGNRLTERRSMQPLSVPQELVTQRFIRDAAGAPRAVGSSIPIPRPAFQQRIDRMRQGEAAPSNGPSGPQTEEAIELGLAFLARTQRKDGRWRLQDYDTEVLIRSDTAATALSVLAFQGAGYTHRQFKYAPNVAKGIAFLVANQKADGDLYVPQDPASDQNGWLYSHSIAALALCEAYGMTQDPALREPAQRAVQFMVNSQDPQYGGWRYRPGRGTDTSVTGWFMMALQSAQLAGLEVAPSTRAGVQRWLVASRGEGAEAYLYRYNPNAANTPAQRHGLIPNPTMTSVGLLMSLYNGGKKESPEMVRGADYLLGHLPQEGNSDKSLRDTYYWYYSTQVMFHMGDEHWRKWYESLYPMLVRTQVREGGMSGSWEPLGDVPDLWGKHGGRLYVTTMNLLSLEVSYRHLPLYESSSPTNK
jgi:hypothetical protein